MQYIETIAELRAACDRARAQGGRVGLVPTMGYLHEGHRSLIRAARAATDLVVVTIFVNPLQFGANEDLDRYPRDLSGDLAGCEAEGVDVVFAPYGARDVSERGAAHHGPRRAAHRRALRRARPTHFDGVTTVVAKLFAITGPCTAFFGRKDAQQLAVITRMVGDLEPAGRGRGVPARARARRSRDVEPQRLPRRPVNATPRSCSRARSRRLRMP